MTEHQEDELTAPQVAALIGSTRQAVNAAIRAGRLAARLEQTPRGPLYRVLRADAEAYRDSVRGWHDVRPGVRGRGSGGEARDAARLDLFAGIPVADFAAARRWYERLLGSPPAFFPHDAEAVWELADHRYLYIVQQPEHAGHARHTLFVDDLDARVAEIADRGLDPVQRETYAGGVRKITYRDPDGNEIGFGGASL